MKTMCFILACSLSSLSIFTIDGQNRVDYGKQIEPIFQTKCAHCHNHTTRQGGLNLESYSALMNGGKNGPSVVPGQGSESRVVKMLEGTIEPRMPLGDRMTADEIKLIKAWIDAGAVGPGSSAAAVESAPAKIETSAKSSLPEIKPTVAVRAAISSLAYAPDGELLALGRYREVELINQKGSAGPTRLPGLVNQVRALAFSADGKLLAAAGGNPAQFGEIKIWRVSDRTELFSFRGHRDNIFAIAFSPDGARLATCSYDKLVKLWDVASGKEISSLKDHTDAVFSLAFSPDGKRLASGSADRTVKIWDVATGQRLYSLNDALDAVNSIAFHPAGKLLAGAGADRVIRIWELGETGGKQIKSLIAHEDAINQIAFSPDGKNLVSTGADQLLKLWDAATLVEVQRIELQPDWVDALAFSPDGKRIVVGRHDGSTAFYDAVTGKNLSRKQ